VWSRNGAKKLVFCCVATEATVLVISGAESRLIMKCRVCGKGVLARVDDILSVVEGFAFVERGRRCPVCGEEFIDQADSDRTVKVARRLGIWGEPLKLHRKFSPSGHGVVLRIPEDLLKGMNLKGSETVSMSKVGKNRILLEVQTS
jgi:hypothetical protein